METTRQRLADACVDGLCSVLAAHPDWLDEIKEISFPLAVLAPDVRWARAMRTWADARVRAVAGGEVPYPDDLAAAVGYCSFLKGADWDAVLTRLGVLATA